MPLLKGNLHSHTVFSDGSLTLAAVVGRYSSLGYDFIAITDHAEQIPDDYWSRIPRAAAGLLVLRGVEIDWPGLGQHVGKILGDAESLYVLNHPGRYGLSVTQLLERVDFLRKEGAPIDAVEVTDGGVYQAGYDVDEIPLAKVATDDTHRDPHFGRAWIEVSCLRRPDAILKAIKAGDCRVAFRSGPPRPSWATDLPGRLRRLLGSERCWGWR